MKVLAIVLLCAFAAVQGRSTAVKVQATKAVATEGEYPYRVHLRLAVSTSGFLETCGGSLLGDRHILTTASCVDDSRFIWIRYGGVTVFNPELVTESNAILRNPDPDVDVALININRNIDFTVNISPISFVGGAVQNVGIFTYYGENDGAPGEILWGSEVSRANEKDSDLITYNGDVVASRFDIGAPLVKDNIQFAILAAVNGENAGEYLPLAPFVGWLEEQTGLDLTVPEPEEPVEPETEEEEEEEEEDSSSSSSSSSSSEEDSLKVKVANLN